jgi:hypothetical protein
MVGEGFGEPEPFVSLAPAKTWRNYGGSNVTNCLQLNNVCFAWQVSCLSLTIGKNIVIFADC